ncbi:MAG: hypothetical protein MJ236_04155 [Clostridia bacterium]|nr:hypothetical protein [Clostridia bacterium]
MRKYRLRIGLDVDDTLYDCNGYALSILSQKYPDEPPFDIQDLKAWGNTGRHAEERIALYKDPEFVRSQPVFPGAQKLVRELSKIADVFFVTAVPASCMSARAERLISDFPEVPETNIIVGSRKDVMSFDILLDDAAHNISNSRATYPVLLRRPWNTHLSGILSVNTYDDFLHFAKMVRTAFIEKTPDLSNGGVLCLVGPTGSKKNSIAKELVKFEGYEKPITTTTRPKRDAEENDAYRFISEDEFIKEIKSGHFIESTVYSKYYFGTSESEINPIVERGHYAVIPIDICGALTIKNKYKSKALAIFINREKSDVLYDIITRDLSDDDKVRRILSLDLEYSNIEMCDYEVKMDQDPLKAAQTIMEIVTKN